MPEDARVVTLAAHGWVMVGKAGYTNPEVADRRIVLADDGYGWRCYDADELVVGHSRYATLLTQYLEQLD